MCPALDVLGGIGSSPADPSARACASRRAIIKLGVPSASLIAFDIDTSNFSGNEGPAGSVEGVYAPDREPTNNDAEVRAGPTARSLARSADRLTSLSFLLAVGLAPACRAARPILSAPLYHSAKGELLHPPPAPHDPRRRHRPLQGLRHRPTYL